MKKKSIKRKEDKLHEKEEKIHRMDEKVHEKIKALHKKQSGKKRGDPKHKSKVEVVMHEFKDGKLRSGSKKGPRVTNPKQAIAIALSEARKYGVKIPKKHK